MPVYGLAGGVAAVAVGGCCHYAGDAAECGGGAERGGGEGDCAVGVEGVEVYADLLHSHIRVSNACWVRA